MHTAPVDPASNRRAGDLPAAAGGAATRLADPRHSALVLVDYQQRLMPALHGGAAVLVQAVRLGQIARALGVPVIGTEQNPEGLGPNDAAVRALCDQTLSKRHFDACEDGLLDHLARWEGHRPAVREVVLAGCEAHVCLMQTALGLLRAGLGVRVVAQACGSRAPADHALAMQRLAQAGAAIVGVEMLAFEWLRSCDHPRFRALLPLLKAAPDPDDRSFPFQEPR